MASLKGEKPVGSQPQLGQVKKEPAKAPAPQPDPKKAGQKPREPKKKVLAQASGGKSAAKN